MTPEDGTPSSGESVHGPPAGEEADAGAAAATTRGLVIAAPASGSGKTTVTLALLRHLRNAGVRVASLKVGPDYIDPAFHAAASGRPCRNLDVWAMRRPTLTAAISAASEDADLVVAEGVMGLFDGATVDEGSTADAAALTGWPVVLVVDASAMAASAAAVVQGFAGFRDDVAVAGVVYNRGRKRTARRAASRGDARGTGHPGARLPGPRGVADPSGSAISGWCRPGSIPISNAFSPPPRETVGAAIEVDALLSLPRRARIGPTDAATPTTAAAAAGASAEPLPMLGQRIAVACDEAFAFAYPLVLEGWQQAGAEVTQFSPIAGEVPPAGADAVYLPGGYPELHAGPDRRRARIPRGAARRGRPGAAIYGECGGYMVLGEVLVDADGEPHAMAGLLPLATTFAERRLTLGYRTARTLGASPIGPAGARFRGHEFHYARVLHESGDAALFRCADARGNDLGPAGRRVGTVAGSFVHLIDRDE